jgi:predicted phosphoribosyltransferase
MITGQRYHDRREAGRILATQIHEQIGNADAVVFALPRGGVPIGLEVARELDAPLDVCVVRKLGRLNRPEPPVGAIAPGGFEVLNEPVVRERGLSPFEIAAIADRETMELQRCEARYHGCRPAQDPHGRIAIVVDDGLATGCSMRAAIGALRDQGASRVIVAAPVGASHACEQIADEVDQLICPLQLASFQAIADWYDDFPTTTDADVESCLAAAALNQKEAHGSRHEPG